MNHDYSTLSRRAVLLLALAVFINFVDRGALATASPLLKSDLNLSNLQIGVLISAFFWTYAPAQLFAGWLAARADVRLVLGAGLAVWAIATVLTGFAAGFAVILALRILLGLSESIVFPCSSVLLARGMPERDRGKANGIISAGMALGPAVGTLVGGLVVAHFGWRVMFIAFGAASLAWLLPWFATHLGDNARPKTALARGPGYLAIIRQRSAWGAALGHFCSTYALYFVLSWLPLYLVKSQGFTVPQMATIGAIVYTLYAASSTIAGRASDRWINGGANSTRARKTIIVTGMAGVGLCMVLSAVAGPRMAVLLLGIAAIFFGLQTPMVYAIGQCLAGPTAAGKWIGFQNFVGNLSGIFGPIVTGMVVDKTGHFSWAFVIAAAICVVGMFAWGIIVRQIEPIPWIEKISGNEMPKPIAATQGKIRFALKSAYRDGTTPAQIPGQGAQP